MQGAVLDDVYGVRSDFKNANLDKVIFDNASLHGASFKNASLTGVSFREDTLQRTKFSGADFSGAVDLDQSQIDSACAAPGSPPILSAGFAPPPPFPAE